MLNPRLRNLPPTAALCLCLAGLFAMQAGCAPDGTQLTYTPASRNITQIVPFWPQDPWLRDNRRVHGIRVPTYFVSGDSQKGVFVPRTIFVWLHELAESADGRIERNLLHMWELDERRSYGLRVTREAILGKYYGFLLTWPETLHLEGKLIEIQIGYERDDQRMILSSPKEYSVPIPGNYRSPPTTSDS